MSTFYILLLEYCQNSHSLSISNLPYVGPILRLQRRPISIMWLYGDASRINYRTYHGIQDNNNKKNSH